MDMGEARCLKKGEGREGYQKAESPSSGEHEEDKYWECEGERKERKEKNQGLKGHTRVL